jgi:hypothetical protein
MDRWKDFNLSKDEEEGITAEEDVVCADEIFRRTLVGKLWTESSYNVRAFKQTMTQAWRLKHPVDIQDLNKNLFLFCFSSKRDAETVMRNGPWSFDRNLLILDFVSGDEQPAELELNRVSFWFRIYELPLKMRTDAMAKKIGDLVGTFEDVDQRDGCRYGKFLRVKSSIDLRKPLKRGTVVHYQDRNLKVYFKYERLPNFCYVCGRIGHQIRDCDEIGDKEGESYEDIEESELAYGLWMRASPLPRMTNDQWKESSSSNCSKNLFASTNTSKCDKSDDGKEAGVEVEQQKTKEKTPEQPLSIIEGKSDKAKQKASEKQLLASDGKVGKEISRKDIECMAETLGTVSISNPQFTIGSNLKKGQTKTRKWVRQKGVRKQKEKSLLAADKELGKRQLVDVTISEGNPEDFLGSDKKRKQDVDMVDSNAQLQEVVLDDQHRLQQ